MGKGLFGIVANMLDCTIIVSEFKFQLCNYVHFQTKTCEKHVNSQIDPTMGQILPLLLFYKIEFGIK